MNKIINQYFKYLFFILSVFITSQVIANEETSLPLWELSLGAGAVHQPFYTGTKQTRQFAFPVVVPTYRGKIFRSDDEGIRAQLFRSERLALDLSADLNLAIKSDDVDLRKGMDDIENIVQFGPSLELLLSEKENSSLMINVPIRGAFEIGNDFKAVGVTISPNLFYEQSFPMLNAKWNFGAAIGPQFGTARYNDIFYGVDSKFATDERKQYTTESGYAGSRLQLSLNSKNKKRSLLWFMRYENIDGATFEDSPLVETDHNVTVGFIYARNIFKSKRRVNP